MGQTVKLRRSAVSGKKPNNSQLELGELSVNTTDGKLFFAKSGSSGPSVEEIITTNAQNTGSLEIVGSITGSNFTGSFIGDASGLYNIPVSGVTGLSLDKIENGLGTASIDSDGLQVNVNTSITGSLTATEFTGSGLGLTNVPIRVSGSSADLTLYDDQYTKFYFDDSTGIKVEGDSTTGIAKIYLSGVAAEGTGTEGKTSKLEVTTASSTWTLNHNLGEQYPAITVFDSNGNVIIPQNIDAVSTSQLVVSFASPQTGVVTATVGGGLPTISSSYDGRVLAVNSTGTAAEWKEGILSSSISFNTYTSSIDSFISTMESTTSSLKGRVDLLEQFSTSLDDTFATDHDVQAVRSDFNTYTSSNDSINSTQNGRLSSLETKTGSLDNINSTQNSRLSSLETKTGSLDNDILLLDGRLDSLEIESGSIRSTFNSYTSSNNNTNTTQNNRLSSLETKSGSLEGRINSLETTSGSHNTRIGNLETFRTNVGNGIEFTGSNVTIKGDLLVKGTQTTVNSTTVEVSDNIISLNGSGAANGGIEVRDVTSPNTVSGSLLWDGVNNYWIGGAKGSEEKILTVLDTGSFLTATNLSTLEGKVSSLETESGSIRSAFNTYTSSNNTTNTTQNSRLSSIETKTGSLETVNTTQNGRLSSLETFTGSINTTIKSKLNSDGVHSGSYLGTSTTDNLTEGSSNLYYTDARVDDRINLKTGVNLDLSSKDTDDLSEGSTNLYYTDGRVKTKLNTEGVISGSIQVNITGTTGYGTISGKLNSLETESGSIRTAFNTYTSSNDGRNSAQDGRLNSLELFTGSIDATYATDADVTALRGTLNTYTSSNNTTNSTQNSRLSSLESFTGSIDATYATDADVTALRGTLNTYTSSNDTTNTTQNGRLTSLESKTGSFITGYTETQTLQDVTDLGSTTTNGITVAGLDTTTTISVGGTNVVDSNRRIYGTGTASNTTPAFTFAGDTDTGLSRIGTDSVGLIAGASRKFYVSGTNAFFQNLTGGLQLSDVPLTVNSDATITGSTLAGSFRKIGGVSTEFLKADGSVDTNTYLTSHPSVSAATSSNNSGRTYIQDILLDTYGHITGLTTATETVVNTDTNYYTTGTTWNGTTATLTFTRNDGGTYQIQMLETLTDVTVTGGTYNSGTQTLRLTKSDGSTVDVSGFAIDTDVNWYTTGATFNTSTGVITGTRNDGVTWTVDIDGKYSELGHNHDDRYYTESESDSLFLNSAGDTMTGDLVLRNDTAGDNTIVRDITWNSTAAEGTDDRLGLIRVYTSAGSSTTRGGQMNFYTRQSNSANFNTMIFDRSGNLYVPTNVYSNNQQLATQAWVGSQNYLTQHPSVSAASSSDNSGRTYIQDILLDSFGHITGITTATETVVNTDTITRVGTSGNEVTGTVTLAGSGATSVNQVGNTITISSTNTTYTAGGGLTLSGTQFSHADTSAQASSNNSGRTYIQDILLDTYGHITGITTATETVVNTDTNYYTTGATWTAGTATLTFTRNDGGTYNVQMLETLTDVTVTGGTYNSGTQTLRLTKSDGSTVDVSGFAVDTDVNWYTTGATFNTSTGVITGTRNDGGTWTVDIDGKYLDATSAAIHNQLYVTGGDADTYTRFGIYRNYAVNGPIGGHNTILHVAQYDGNYGFQLGADTTSSADGLYYRSKDTTIGTWKQVASRSWVTSQNYLTQHPTISAASSSNNSGRTYIQDILLDTYGHITGITTATETVVNTDTNYYTTGATFNTGDGVVTFTRNNGGTYTVDLDGRYLQSESDTLASVTARGATTSQNITINGQLTLNNGLTNGSGQALIVGGSGDVTLSDGGSLFFGAYDYAASTYIRGYDNGNYLYFYLNGTNSAYLRSDGLTVNGTIWTNSHGNSSQWNTAYGWGNHASAGYLTAHPTINGVSSNNSGRTYIQDVLTDANGHVTGLTTATETVVDTNYYTTGATFNTSNGVITFTRNNGGTYTVDIDGKYAESGHNHDTSYLPMSYTDVDMDAYDTNKNLLLGRNVGSWSSGTKPAGSHNGFGVLQVTTHDSGYATQLGFDTNQNTMWVRSANPSTWGSWSRLWSDSNDGSGSGLDADLLDGQEGSYYLNYNNFSNTPTIGNGTITVSAGGGLSGSGSFTVNQTGATSITISHADTSAQGSVNNSGRTYIQDILLDTYGHITGITSATETVTDTNYYTTGTSFNSTTGILTFTRNDGGTYTANLLSTLSDVTVTGGTYNSGTQTLTLTKSDGNTVSVSGFAIDTDVNWYTTSASFNATNGVITGTRNDGGTWTADLGNVVYGNAKGTNDSVTTDNDGLDKTGYYTSGGFTTRPSGVANWMYIEHIKLYNSNTGYQKQIGYDTYDNRMWVRTKNNGTWSGWGQIWTSDVFSNNSSNWDTAYTYSTVGHLPLAGGTLTGNLTLNSAYPEILFNGTSDAGVDMAIKATPEGLDFYEPEDTNKIHFRIYDDTGVDAPFGYSVNGTQVITSGRVLQNVSGNISMFTNNSGYLTSFDITTQTDSKYLRSDIDDSFNGSLTSAQGAWIKFYHSNQTDSNDGKIGSGIFDTGLNIVGTQTSAGTGRQVRVWGSLITDSGATYWHSGNDGAGSGLDADNLDGSTWGSTNKTVRWDGGSGYHGNPRSMAIGYSGGNYGQFGYGLDFTGTSNVHTYAINDIVTRVDMFGGLIVYGAAGGTVGTNITWTETFRARYNESAPTFKGNTIWHSGNDGSGSGLDADTVDGVQASSFTLRSDNYFKPFAELGAAVNLNDYRSSGYASQNSNSQAGAGSNYPTAFAGMFEVVNDDTGNGLHTTQRYARYNTNDFYARNYYNGSWTSWTRFLTTEDEGSGNGLDADTLDGLHASSFQAAGSYLTTTGTAADSDKLDGYHLAGSTSAGSVIFNNKGLNHSTQTDFNTVMTPGANFLQGGTNGPTGTASHQWYGLMLGLGADYGTSTGSGGHYANQLYWARQAQGGGGYLWARDMEGGSWGSWRKMSAGYADSAGNADTLDGLDLHTGRNNEVNKVVRTDGNGYIQAGWINTTSGAFSSTIDRIYCSDDGYVRYQTPANFISNLGLITTSNISSQSVSYANSAGNADTVDSLHASSFMRTDAQSTTSGHLIIESNWSNGSTYSDQFTIRGTYPSMSFRSTNADSNVGGTWLIHMDSSGDLQWYSSTDGPTENWTKRMSLFQNGTLQLNSNTVWHTGNDGSGSGLDSDLLDGQHGSYYTNAGNLTGTIGDVFTPGTRYNIGLIDGNGTQTRDKIRVWDSASYTIGMKSGYTYGWLGKGTDGYAMSFQMSNTQGRGFWWGDDGHGDSQGAMSLTTDGKATIATSLTVGEGESITAPSSTTLYVKGNTQYATVFDVQGTQGQLFSITDDLTGDIFKVSDISGIPILNVNSSGTVTIDETLNVYGDVTAYYSSDERLKDNVTPIINAIDKMKLIGGYEFDWNENSKHEGHDVGVIAQEIEKVLPEVVTTRSNGYKAVKYEKLTALLIQANKELIQKVEELERKLK